MHPHLLRMDLRFLIYFLVLYVANEAAAGKTETAPQGNGMTPFKKILHTRQGLRMNQRTQQRQELELERQELQRQELRMRKLQEWQLRTLLREKKAYESELLRIRKEQEQLMLSVIESQPEIRRNKQFLLQSLQQELPNRRTDEQRKYLIELVDFGLRKFSEDPKNGSTKMSKRDESDGARSGGFEPWVRSGSVNSKNGPLIKGSSASGKSKPGSSKLSTASKTLSVDSNPQPPKPTNFPSIYFDKREEIWSYSMTKHVVGNRQFGGTSNHFSATVRYAQFVGSSNHFLIQIDVSAYNKDELERKAFFINTKMFLIPEVFHPIRQGKVFEWEAPGVHDNAFQHLPNKPSLFHRRTNIASGKYNFGITYLVLVDNIFPSVAKHTVAKVYAFCTLDVSEEDLGKFKISSEDNHRCNVNEVIPAATSEDEQLVEFLGENNHFYLGTLTSTSNGTLLLICTKGLCKCFQFKESQLSGDVRTTTFRRIKVDKKSGDVQIYDAKPRRVYH